MRTTKKTIQRLVIVLGLVAVGFILFFDLIGAGTQASEMELGEKRTVTSTIAENEASAFVHNGRLYVAFQQRGGEYIYTTYTDSPATADSWSYHNGVPSLQTETGVEAVTFSYGASKEAVCLMATQPGSKSIYYTCSDLGGESLVWSAQKEMNTDDGGDKGNLGGTILATQSPTDSYKFYITTNSVINPDNDTFHIDIFTCHYNGTIETGSFDCTRQQPTQGRYRGPSIVADENERLYTFFREGDSDNFKDIIYYYTDGMSNNDPIKLTNKDKNSKETKLRTDAYNYYGTFVAYKNKDNAGISYSKISKTALNDDFGKNQWTHCNPKDNDGWVMRTAKAGPTLFEYNDDLYILYNDEENNDKLTYIKIADPVDRFGCD